MSEFDEWFRRTRKFFEEIDRMFEDLLRREFPAFEERGRERGGRRVYGPYFYGFSVTIGPDGVPRIKEWGNIKPGRISPVVSEAIEPFTDVIEEEDKVRIVVDVPGVEKEDINVEATEDEVLISATRGDRKYRKVVKLPAKVKPDTAKATYKNGVLTVTIEKVEKGKKGKGFKIQVE